MRIPRECRLLIDPPGAGAWNMAVDELLLEWSAEQDGCCWRMYRWLEPTLSLGYFQKISARLRHRPSRSCPAVRRLTGGGAIVHDAELTYSVVVPAGHPLAARRNSLYETIHTSLIEALGDWGIAATIREELDSRQRQDEEPFLCFRRRAPGDVLVGPTKIAGSAQRRRRGAVLQHGSVLLRRCQAAPELTALEDLTGRIIAAGELADAWLVNLSGRLSAGWRDEPLSDAEHRRAADLAKNRYASACWTACWTDNRGR